MPIVADPSAVATDPDAALLADVARGDRRAFEAFYRRHERRCFGFARQILRDPSAAEEVVVESMLEAWRHADRYDSRSRVTTWLLGIVRHKALDQLRRSARAPERASVDALDALPDPHSGPGEQLMLDEALQHLEAALDRLSAELREALRLAFVEELPYESIATVLEIPVNTVKTRVFHARQRLRTALADVGGTGPVR